MKTPTVREQNGVFSATIPGGTVRWWLEERPEGAVVAVELDAPGMRRAWCGVRTGVKEGIEWPAKFVQ